jgi:hypothetical protein
MSPHIPPFTLEPGTCGHREPHGQRQAVPVPELPDRARDRVTNVTSPGAEHLDSRHRDTVRQIFEHPTSHNIEWRAVRSLLDAIGTVDVRHDGKVEVKLGPELEFLEPPAGKDVDDQMVVDLRRMLTKAGYRPH